MSGPDLTPQGLADAIDRLVVDLPGKDEKASGSWQKVLTLQALSMVLGGNWSDQTATPDFHRACLEAQGAVGKALRMLLRERSALHGALATAYDLEGWTPERGTAFSKTPLGQTIIASLAWLQDDGDPERPEGGAA